MAWSTASTAIALQVNDKQNTEQKQNRSHNLQVHLDWNFPRNSVPEEMTTATTSALGCLQGWRGAAEPGPGQRWQCHPVHATITTAFRHWIVLLCNQLACSSIILQLITWAANRDQRCPKKEKFPSKPVSKISQQQLSGSPQSPNNWTLRTK